MNRKLLISAAFLGGTAVILGAFAAHGLKAVLDDKSLESFNTGVRYQMYHSFFLMVLAALSAQFKEGSLKWIYRSTMTGVLFFSLSIYLLNLGPVMGMDMRFLGPVTPLGGLMLIAAWFMIPFGLKKD